MSSISISESRRPATPAVERSDGLELSAKARILLAAEKLFAEKGIEASSLREVALLAGQKNVNAVQYHFGGKDELISAIRKRHEVGVGERRRLLLAQLPKKATVRQLIEVIVAPSAQCLHDGDSGRHYLQIMAQLISLPSQGLLTTSSFPDDPALEQVIEKLETFARHLGPEDRTVRMLYIAGAIFHTLSDYIRLNKADQTGMACDELNHDSCEVLVRNLVAMISAALEAPLS